MDNLTFITEIISALIWPITVVLIILMLRRSILELIPRLTELSYGNFRLEFDEEMEQIKAQAAVAGLAEDESAPVLRSAAAPSVTAPPSVTPVVYPKGAIIDAWRAVEDVLDDLLVRKNKPVARTAQSKAKVLKEEGVLDEPKLKLLGDLWGLRNMAAYEKEFQPTPQQAAEYTQVAEQLIKSIDK